MAYRNTKPSKFIVRKDPDKDFVKFAQNSYKHLLYNISLDLPRDLEHRLLIQSIPGHSQAGHVGFAEEHSDVIYRYIYENSSMHDVVKALDLNPEEILLQTQKEIGDFSDWLEDSIYALKQARDNPSKKRIMPSPRAQKDLIGMATSKKTRGVMSAKELKQYLAGVYLGGCMDSSSWRREVQKVHDTNQMHTGTVMPINLEKLSEQNLTLAHLQSGEYRSRLGLQDNKKDVYYLNTLVERGVVKLPNGIDTYVLTDDSVRSEYIEFTRGSGTSDDAAMITAGLLFGKHAFFGVEAIDRIDTLEKYSQRIILGGADEQLAQALKSEYEAILDEPFMVSDSDVHALIYSATKNENDMKKVSSSQRYFWQIRNKGFTAPKILESHLQYLDYICGKSNFPQQQDIGFERMNNHQFYASIQKSLRNARNKGLLSDPQNILSTNPRKLSVNNHKPVLYTVERAA